MNVVKIGRLVRQSQRLTGNCDTSPKTAAELINQTSGLTEYYTPPFILDAAWSFLGEIDLDPASSEQANKLVKARRFYAYRDKGDNGLIECWDGRIWLNHPFGRGQNGLWISKLIHEFAECSAVTEALCITYACTSEAWFQPLLQFPQCFLCPRTNYLLPDGRVLRGVTKGSVVTCLAAPDRLPAFVAAFGKLGVIKGRAL